VLSTHHIADRRKLSVDRLGSNSTTPAPAATATGMAALNRDERGLVDSRYIGLKCAVWVNQRGDSG